MASSAERKNIIELLELYHSMPALWDVTCEDYTNREIRKQQYEILLDKYRERNPDADRKEVARKINVLRTNYKREVKRLNELKETCNTTTKPTLYYFNSLTFLDNIKTPRGSVVGTLKVSRSPEQSPEVQARQTCSPDFSAMVPVKKREVKRLKELNKFEETARDNEEPTMYYFNGRTFLDSPPPNTKIIRSPKLSVRPLQQMVDEEATRSSVVHEQQVRVKVDKEPEPKRMRPSCSTNDFEKEPEPTKTRPSSTTDDLLRLASERLRKPPNTFQQIGSIWGHKLKTMERSQRIIAEKLINDIMFNGELGLLNYDTNITHLGCPANMSYLTPQYEEDTMEDRLQSDSD